MTYYNDEVGIACPLQAYFEEGWVILSYTLAYV